MPIPRPHPVGRAAVAALALLIPLPALAQPLPPAPVAPFEAASLAQLRGVVARYTLGPRGEVEGLILTDGTQVQVPPHLGAALVFTARPGEAVTVHGLRAIGVPMMAAISVRNDATGAEVVDAGGGPRDRLPPRPPRG